MSRAHVQRLADHAAGSNGGRYRITLARKLAVVLHRMWVSASTFDFEKANTRPSRSEVPSPGRWTRSDRRYLRLLHAGALGKSHRPALERAAVDRPRQDDMSGLIENGAHRTVTYLANPTADVGFA